MNDGMSTGSSRLVPTTHRTIGLTNTSRYYNTVFVSKFLKNIRLCIALLGSSLCAMQDFFRDAHCSLILAAIGRSIVALGRSAGERSSKQ